jgi:hypothetical protein
MRGVEFDVRSIRSGGSSGESENLGLFAEVGGIDVAGGSRGGLPVWSHSEAAVVAGAVNEPGGSVCGCSYGHGGVYQGSLLHSPTLADACALHSY